MRRDGQDGPGRTRRTGRTRTPLRAASPGERGAGPLANYALLFILFFALSWGPVFWDEVFINTSDAAADTVHAVLTGAGRPVPALCKFGGQWL